ncbi:MAG: gluconate 2-dehydrogenase subunit 3 family protein, partial [Opitutus sp.]
MLTAAATPLLRGRAATPGSGATPALSANGYGTDPDLLKDYQPGAIWPLTLSADQRATVRALCDTIIPADDRGPAASAVGVHDFIDEWISAPYPGHADDRRAIVDGVAWLEAESSRRFGNSFGNLVVRQKTAICDDICHVPDAAPEYRAAAEFFRRFRDLAAGGYYTTPAGMKDIGYVGNVALG